MKSKKGIYARLLLWTLALLLAAPPGGVMAQGQDQGGQPTFRQEELDQMLAPIALYPDDLLVQVLMAATYPLEVVQAARWVQANPNLAGDQLAAALEQQDWDPSVKSMVNFPSVLQMLNDRLEWTQKLGDAFLAQKDQVMDTVQKLRQRAQGQGYLKTTSQERVMVDPQSQEIAIEPPTPQEMYVPAYDPAVVYGPWWWPAYPPYYYYPPGLVITGGFIGFGVGLGLAWGYAWGGFDWHRHGVSVNITRNARFNNRIDRNWYVSHVTTGGGGQGAWRHDPAHRGGVAYRTPSVAQQFGRGPCPGPVRVRTSEDLMAVEREGLPPRHLSGRLLRRRELRRGLFRPGLRHPDSPPVPHVRRSRGCAVRRRLAAAVPATKHSRRVAGAMQVYRVLVLLPPPSAEPPPAEVLLAVVDVTGEPSISRRPIRYGGYGDVASQRCQRKVALRHGSSSRRCFRLRECSCEPSTPEELFFTGGGGQGNGRRGQS